MKKLLLSIFAMLVCAYTYAQDLPKIIPPSPEASSLAKFSEVPVSHYTGLPSINIPIYTIQQNGMNIPIGLSYHARGIKVEEIAPRVGLGWALSYGGSISRQIRGKADEAGDYGYLTNSHYDTFFNSSSTRNSLWSTYVLHNDYDFTPDQFFFNANGVSGKFIFDYSTNAPLIQKYKDVSIERRVVQGEVGISGFIVKDSNGNTYYFGVSKDATRTAINRDNVTNSFVYSQPGSMAQLSAASTSYPNAWQLMEIEGSNGDLVSFYYTDPLGTSTEADISYFYRRSYDKIDRTGPSNVTQSFFSNINSNQYLIREIHFKKGKIKFNKAAVERDDITGAHALASIELYNEKGTLIKRHLFNYQYVTSDSDNNQLSYLKTVDPKSSTRMFLKNIQEQGSDGALLPPYVFDYSTVKLPNRFSNSQDAWGYYNGANNGNYLTFFDYGVSSIDRKVDIVKAEAGLLKKITYPTKGSTKFIYEHNKGIASADIKNVVMSATNPTKVKSVTLSHLEHQSYFNGIDEYVKPFTISGASAAKILDKDMWFTDQAGCVTGLELATCKFQISIYGTDPSNASVHFMLTFNSTNGGTLQPGNYAIKVKALNHTHNPLNMNHGFYVNYSWEEESVSVDESLYAGGKRIKRIENYDENNVLSTKKEYQYLNNLNESSGRIFGLPNFYGVNRILSAVTGLTILQPIGAVGGSPLSTYEGNSVGYTQVTEFNGGENDSKGKIVYEFTTEAAHAFQYDPNSNIADPGYYYDFPYHMPTDKEWLRGKNLKTTYFKSSNNVYTKVREIENKYLYADEDAGGVSSSISFSPVSTIKLLSENLTTSNLLRINTDRKFRLPLITFKPSIDPNTGIIDPYGPTYYKTFYITGGTLDLESSTVTDYYDNGNAVVSTSNYFYNYDKHYQIKRTKTVDSFGETILSNMVYPQDKTSLTTAEGLLKAAHIFTPLQTYSYQDDDKNGIGSTSELLSSQYTLYKDWGNNNILPEKVQTAKGEASFEDRIVFHRYYANGKVKEVSKKDGTPIVYIWGYKQTLPIAKIENATYADVSSYVATLQTLSDADVDRTIGNTGTEGDLRAMLETMRVALSNAQVTYFTYDPLIGTTSITGPRGRTIYYQYDSFNRLEFVKDHDGNILSKNEYNYKN